MHRSSRPIPTLVTALTLPLFVAGCALRHDQIAPANIDPAAYAQASCEQLSRMQAKTRRTLILAEVGQDKFYEDDRTRTFGVPTPMATLFGEGNAAEVARLKGDAIALAAQLGRAGCMRDG